MILNSFVIILVIFSVFRLVRGKTLEVDVSEKASELLSELRLAGNNSGKGIQVVYAGKDLKARGVSDGDILISVDGVDAVPSISFSTWIDGLGENQTGGVGVFPLVDVDTIGEGPITTDGFLLKGFLRIQVIPLGDAATLQFSRPSTYLQEEYPNAEAKEEKHYKQGKPSKTNQELQSGKTMKKEGGKEKEKEKEKLDMMKGSRSGETEHSNRYRDNPRVFNRPTSDKAAVGSTEDRRKAGDGFAYAAVFNEVGPMGIVFNMTAEETTVAQVIAGSPAHKHGVHVGDVIISVNDHDCSGLGSSAIGKMVMEAEWPRTLVFRVPETISEPEAQRLSLYIFSPAVLRGVHEVRTPVGWGGNLTSGATSSCETVPIVVASPEFACERVGTLKPLPPPSATSAIVLVKRGTCSFVDKAATVQEVRVGSHTPYLNMVDVKCNSSASSIQLIDTALHGAGRKGRGSMVLINTKEEYADMPAGNADTTGICVNAAMMLPSGGFQICRVLNWGKGINATAALAPQGTCCNFVQESDRNITDSDIRGVNGEIILMSSQGEERVFNYKLAEFGPTAPKFPITVIPADPSDACDATALRVRVSGSFVVARREGCTFGHKVRAMQKAGAAGLIIANSDNSTLHMQGSEEDQRIITVPCVMVPSTLWQWVTNQMTPQSDIVGRLYPSSLHSTATG